MTFRAKWRTDQELLSRPSRGKLSQEEFDRMMAEIHEHEAQSFKAQYSDPFAVEEESSQAFIDSARCNRWGSGDDKCTLAYQHLGPCVDATGRSTLTLAADILRGRR